MTMFLCGVGMQLILVGLGYKVHQMRLIRARNDSYLKGFDAACAITKALLQMQTSMEDRTQSHGTSN